MVEILELKDDIVKVLFYINLILLIIGIFLTSKTYFIIVIVINLIFNGTFMVICKWSHIFNAEGGYFAKSFGKLGSTLDYFHNIGRKNG